VKLIASRQIHARKVPPLRTKRDRKRYAFGSGGIAPTESKDMSRAFVREVDDVKPAPILERSVSAAPNLVTPRGARLIEQAVVALEERIASATEKQALPGLRRDLRYWNKRRSNMQIVPPVDVPGAVEFGARATIRRGGWTGEISIVGEDEADPSAGLIAWTAPLARALKGARVGETVELEAGGGVEPVTVLAIDKLPEPRIPKGEREGRGR
jgi:transcription elongation GreA/GreB family factor